MKTKKTKIVCIALITAFLISFSFNTPEFSKTKKSMNTSSKDSLLRHMVIFKFNDSASEADVQKLNESFIALKKHIPVIQDFEWGLNNSPENFHQGFTHCYLLTFKSEKDRDSVYTPHPKHQEFVASLQPFVEKVFVVDYWAN